MFFFHLPHYFPGVSIFNALFEVFCEIKAPLGKSALVVFFLPSLIHVLLPSHCLLINPGAQRALPLSDLTSSPSSSVLLLLCSSCVSSHQTPLRKQTAFPLLPPKTPQFYFSSSTRLLRKHGLLPLLLLDTGSFTLHTSVVIVTFSL